MADGDQLQLILRNVIHNAIKFSALKDTIEVSAIRQNTHCEVTIKDSGIGMKQQEIDNLMISKQPFSKEGTEAEKGTGLGLLLCKEFILRNGGNLTIRVLSTRGLRFPSRCCWLTDEQPGASVLTSILQEFQWER